MINNISEYYSGYDEESRLVKDKAHRVEFDTTVSVLDNYIVPNTRLLDIGAGTGRYSFYYAMQGVSVFAMDLVKKHVDIIANKLQGHKELKLEASQGNALDLSSFKEGEFDTVLCMGPLYHISNKKDQIKCLSECNRVLSSKGILAVAYINRNAHKEFGENPYFSGIEPDYIDLLLRDSGFRIREHIATDGVTPKIGRFINQLDEAEYKQWLDFNISTCRSKAAVENTLHALVIAEKR